MYEPSRVISVSFALTAFSVAILAGLAVGNEAQSVLTRAIFALVICHAVGWIVGVVGKRTMLEHIERYKQSHPVPDLSQIEKSTSGPVLGG